MKVGTLLQQGSNGKFTFDNTTFTVGNKNNLLEACIMQKINHFINTPVTINNQNSPTNVNVKNLFNPFPASRRDSVSFSQDALKTNQLVTQYNNITHICGVQVHRLKAQNNVLNILWDIPYSAVHADRMLRYVKFHSNTNWSNLFADVYREIGADVDLFSHDAFRSDGVTFSILSKLAGGIGEFINAMYCRYDIIDALTAVGIEPGWVEMRSGNHVSRFYFTACGHIKCEESNERGRRSAVNQIDFTRHGMQPGDKVMVNFEYYTVGENGRIYVPKGVPIIWGVTMWMPGEGHFFGWEQDDNGTWYRTRDFLPFVPQEGWDVITAGQQR